MIEEVDFIGRFQGVQQTGGGWIARCPAHGDDNPSLSISRGDDGRWLVHCHAGCSAEAVVEAVGLKLKDLMPETTSRATRHKRERGEKLDAHRAAESKDASHSIANKWGRWVCDYDYTDENGKILYKASRYVKDDGKKTFIIKTPDPKAKYGWSFGLSKANIARVPFHLPRIIAAAKAKKTIIIVEGEKDALNVEKVVGCVATCNVAGAMKWGYKFPENWIEWFKGANVIIIADNDPKTKTVFKRKGGVDVAEELPHWRGQQHAWDVKRQFEKAGFTGKMKLMVMPEGKDFTDWLEARKQAGLETTRADFMEAVKNAAPWPKEWEFNEEDLAAHTEAQDGDRVKYDTPTVSVDEEDSNANHPHRFGRRVPHAPGKRDKWVVDFDIAGGRYATIELNYGWSVQRIYDHAFRTCMKACPNNEPPKGMGVRLKAWSATLWLLMRGSFFWHSDYKDFSTCMFLDRDEKSCTLMRVMSDEFYAFVAKHARLEDVDPKKGDLAKVMGLVKQIAVNEEYSEGTRPGNSWERRGNAVYISSGDTEMCRVKDGTVEFVQNGTDGVVFLRGKTLAPWHLDVGEGIDPFSHAKIFTGASFADENGLMNVRLWTMNLLACHPTKPPLLVTGGAGSGKTRMAKGIKEILGMRQDGALDLSVQQIEDGDKGLDAFWATVNDGKLEVFDNFDTKVKWASDTLQTAATDGQTKRRTLYTTYGVSILKANASIILTSNNPVFSTEGNGGLADRLITIPLTMNRSVSQDSELSRDIAENRDRFLTWMARTIAKVLLDEKPVDRSVNRRHPDYGEFSVKVGRAIGDEEGAIKALGSAEADKAVLPLKNDVVTKEILDVLKDKGWKWSGTSGEMSELIISKQGDDGDDKTDTIFSSRRVGKAFSKYMRQFSLIFKMEEPRLSEGRTRYTFTGLTVLGAASVGLVGLNGDFGKVARSACAYKVMENTALNPPYPPGEPIRARAPSPLPSYEEEDVEKSTEGDLEWDL